MAAPQPKRVKRDYNTTVTVLVGKDERSFTIHKTAACAASKFFKSTCRHKSGAEDKPIRMPKHEGTTFEVFVHWMYTKELDLSVMSSTTAEPFVIPSFLSLGKVWTLAHDLGCPELGNQINDQIILRDHLIDKEKAIKDDTLQYIWDATPKGSTIRRLFTDITLTRSPGKRFGEHGCKWPLDILVAAAQRYFDDKGLKESLMMADRCDYHEHEDGEALWECSHGDDASTVSY